METRICKYCGDQHPIEFYEIANIIKGVKYRRRKCKNCYNEMKNIRRDDIKQWFLH